MLVLPCQKAFRWKQRVDLLDKERSAMEKKSKAAMSQLEKRLNAIKFKDRQYAVLYRLFVTSIGLFFS